MTISVDERLGLTPRERRCVRLRFHEPLDDALRSELAQLMRRRGTAARRAAERIEPLEIVIGDAYGEPERIRGVVEPPLARHGQLRDVEFAMRRLEPAR